MPRTFARKLLVETLTDRIVPAAILDNGLLTVSGAGDLKVAQTGNKVTTPGQNIFVVATGKSEKSVNTSDITEIQVHGDGGPNLIDLRTVRFISATINGEGGGDTIYATQRSDIIDGGEGDDFVRGEDGNDQINGRAGKDKLYGNRGGDTIHGDEDQDYIEGNECQVIHSTGGYVYMFPNYLFGDAEDDVIISDYCGDYMYGGEDDDLMEGNGGNDFMYGEGGNDTMAGGYGNDFMQGEDDNDEMDGEAGNDTMEGEDGEDVMNGGSGNDHIDSGLDNDVANGDSGNDHIDAGDGNDTSDGGSGNDTIDGDIGNDEIRGGTGNDHIDAGAGNDDGFGDSGNDTLEMGDDDDNGDGGGGNDEINGGEGNDILAGFGGNDVIEGEGGVDFAVGGFGNDEMKGGGDNDILHGEIGNDIIEGEEGDDVLTGGLGNDVIEAGVGNDQLAGDQGRDLLVGGPGRDHLDGGTQRDMFHGDVEGENLFDEPNFDTYENAFNLARPVFGTMAIGDIARHDPHLEATLVGLGAAVQKVRPNEFIKNLKVVSEGNYEVQLHGEANPRTVTFDGNWSDNEPIPNAEERLLPAVSVAEKNEFWTILFSRARLAKYNVDPATYHSDTAWNTAHANSSNKLLDEAEAYHDYGPSASSPATELATLTFTELQELINEHAAMIAVAAAGSGLSADKIELGSGYVVTSAFMVNGAQWVRLYNVTGHDTEPHGEKVDNAPGIKKDDGFITLEFSRFKDASNFAELHAWI